MKDPRPDLRSYPLFDALRFRRSRRFGLGMHLEYGPMSHKSAHAPMPLSEEEEAYLAFAGCGITGRAMMELEYSQGRGGSMIGGYLARTIGSPDAAHNVSLAIVNDSGTYLMRRPQDFEPAEFEEIEALANEGNVVEMYRRSRIQLSDRRLDAPLQPPFNLPVNQWDLYPKGSTYFVPIGEYTLMYIIGVLEFLDEEMGVFIVDDRRGFRPAGLKRFARSRGGHLFDNPTDGRVITIQQVESMVHAIVQVELGQMIQNLGLMAHALGLGGFPNFAGHDFAWLRALGFRMVDVPALSYLGAGGLTRTVASFLGRNPPVPFAIGLEKDGKPLLKPYCPPYYPSMKDAVMAFLERKFGSQGLFREGIKHSQYKDPATLGSAAKPQRPHAIEAVIAYCEYVYETYGRFPGYTAPFRTSVGFQVVHLDLEFYQKFYRPEAVSELQKEHLANWHGNTGS
jgi:hypothetical protein